ncbi:MAG: hypothetical protein AAFQ82_27850, partial [Myxococcota bacterium]
ESLAPSSVRAVVGAPYVSRVRAPDSCWSPVESALLAAGGRVMRLQSDGESTDAWIDRTDVVNRDPSAVEQAAASFPLAIVDHGASVTVVGADPTQWRSRALEALGELPIRSMVLGPAELSLFVAQEFADPAVRALHAALIDKNAVAIQ